MKELFRTFRLFAYICALPLIATAAASAHQWYVSTSPVFEATQDIAVDDILKETVVADADANVVDYQYYVFKSGDNGQIAGNVTVFDSEAKSSVPAVNQRVYFTKNGIVVGETQTDDQGQFSMEGMEPGNYSLTVSGSQAFSTFGVQVVEGVDGVFQTADITAVPPRILKLAEELGKWESIVKLATTPGVPTKIIRHNADKTITSRVKLQPDGTLNGRVFSLEDGPEEPVGVSAVSIFQGDRFVTKVNTDEMGRFSIPGMEPGVYDFVAIGLKGIAVVSFEAVANDDLVGWYTSLSNAAMAIAQDLQVPLSNPGATVVQQFFLVGGNEGPIQPIDNGVITDAGPIAFAGDGATFGAASGGGFGPSGFGGGRLIGWAGLAAAIVALSTDSGSSPPSSPVEP